MRDNQILSAAIGISISAPHIFRQQQTWGSMLGYLNLPRAGRGCRSGGSSGSWGVHSIPCQLLRPLLHYLLHDRYRLLETMFEGERGLPRCPAGYGLLNERTVSALQPLTLR